MITLEDCGGWKPENAWEIYLERSQRYRERTPKSFSMGLGMSLTSGFDSDEPSHYDVQQEVERNSVAYALASPRWPVSKVAGFAAAWLVEEFGFEEGATPEQISEWVLQRMLLFPPEAEEVAMYLNKWESWSDQNALSEADVRTVKGHKTTFAMATCMLAMLGKSDLGSEVDVSKLFEELLSRWKDVLLN
jgi:hypothetical protein